MTEREDLSKLTDAGGHVLVFDSGVGGLTVAQEILVAGRGLQVDYAADTGFFPYGDKSDDELRARLPQVARALYEAVRPDVFVIACNTASTLALDEVRAELPCSVVGTVPAIKPAVAASASGVIGLLATPGTIRRVYTDQLIAEFAGDVRVIKHGSLGLVKLAEQVAAGDKPDLKDFATAQSGLFESPAGDEIDTIVLACTHFPLVRDELIASAKHKVAYIDSGEAIARQTMRILNDMRQRSTRQATGRAFITSKTAHDDDLAAVFARFGFASMRALDVK